MRLMVQVHVCCCVPMQDKRWKAAQLLEHPFLAGAAEELLSTGSNGPGGFGTSAGKTTIVDIQNLCVTSIV